MPTKLRTFWRPVNLMTMPMVPQKDSSDEPVGVDTVHTIWLDFIVDEDLVSKYFLILAESSLFR